MASFLSILAPYSKYNVTVNARTRAGDGMAVSRLERTNESSKLLLINIIIRTIIFGIY